MKSKITIFIVSLILITSMAHTAHGQLVICGKHADPVKGCTIDQLTNQVISIVNFLIDSASVLAIAYVLYGGISMILARGNPAKFQAARSIMTNAITGLIIVLIAYMIVSFAIVFLTGGKTFDQIFNFLPHQ